MKLTCDFYSNALLAVTVYRQYRTERGSYTMTNATTISIMALSCGTKSILFAKNSRLIEATIVKVHLNDAYEEPYYESLCLKIFSLKLTHQPFQKQSNTRNPASRITMVIWSWSMAMFKGY